MKKIFIRGTGRSGTTILAKLLGVHDDLYCFPKELRFITDPDGIVSLHEALSSNWDPFRADYSLYRFQKLMKKISSITYSSYPLLDLNKIAGEKIIENWTTELFDELCVSEYKGAWARRATLINKSLLRYFGSNNIIVDSFLPKCYYCSRKSDADFNKIISNALDSLFLSLSKNNYKGVIEHTPTNLNHIDKLFSYLPEAKFIHVFRDPRDIICSYKNQDWGVNDMESNVIWINEVLKQWGEKKKYLSEQSYIEVKFEDLIHKRKDTINAICNFLEINIENSFFDFDLSKHNIGRWKKTLTSKEIALFENKYSHLLTSYE